MNRGRGSVLIREKHWNNLEWQENGALTPVLFGTELNEWTWQKMQDKVMESASRS